jgi:hypothetical protein
LKSRPKYKIPQTNATEGLLAIAEIDACPACLEAVSASENQGISSKTFCMLNCPIVLSEVPRHLLGPITARGFSDCQIRELAKLLPYRSEVLKKGQHKAKRISKNGWQNIPPQKKNVEPS